MVEPKLPKLKKMKKNPTNGKILIKLSGTEIIQVEPEFFAFHAIKKGRESSRYLVVSGEYTSNRFARSIQILDEFREETLWDLMAMSEYSKKYQKWLKSPAKTTTATIECGEKENSSSFRKELKGIEDGR